MTKLIELSLPDGVLTSAWELDTAVVEGFVTVDEKNIILLRLNGANYLLTEEDAAGIAVTLARCVDAGRKESIGE